MFLRKLLSTGNSKNLQANSNQGNVESEIPSLADPILPLLENGEDSKAKEYIETLQQKFKSLDLNGLRIATLPILYHAIIHDCRETVAYLLDHKVDTIFDVEGHETSALYVAMLNKKFDLVFEYLRRYDICHIEELTGNTIFHLGMMVNWGDKYQSRIELLFGQMIAFTREENPDLILRKNKKGHTPLCLAAAIGNRSFVRALLSFGALNVSSEEFNSMLSDLNDFSSKEILCKEIYNYLKVGKELNFIEANIYALLALAVESDNIGFIDFLLNKVSVFSTLDNKKFDNLIQLIKKGDPSNIAARFACKIVEQNRLDLLEQLVNYRDMGEIPYLMARCEGILPDESSSSSIESKESSTLIAILSRPSIKIIDDFLKRGNLKRNHHKQEENKIHARAHAKRHNLDIESQNIFSVKMIQLIDTVIKNEKIEDYYAALMLLAKYNLNKLFMHIYSVKVDQFLEREEYTQLVEFVLEIAEKNSDRVNLLVGKLSQAKYDAKNQDNKWLLFKLLLKLDAVNYIVGFELFLKERLPEEVDSRCFELCNEMLSVKFYKYNVIFYGDILKYIIIPRLRKINDPHKTLDFLEKLLAEESEDTDKLKLKLLKEEIFRYRLLCLTDSPEAELSEELSAKIMNVIVAFVQTQKITRKHSLYHEYKKYIISNDSVDLIVEVGKKLNGQSEPLLDLYKELLYNLSERYDWGDDKRIITKLKEGIKEIEERMCSEKITENKY